jgi:dienelactone hydrolase
MSRPSRSGGTTLRVVGVAALMTTMAMAAGLFAQTKHNQMQRVLDRTLQTSEMVAWELRRYLADKAPRLPSPATADAWTADAGRLRQHVLDDVVFHGWPKAWVDAPPKFEDLGTLPSGEGYRLRKLRYEIVPGFEGAAILYEPEHLAGKVPAILNVDGHHGPIGKAAEFNQKRCITQARQGILALHLDWIGFGELASDENDHWYQAHLDLVGTSGLGLFYLAMRRGLDYLDAHPNVDRSRIGMTGLSGGGWQTMLLSGLDERVAVSVPVAGHSTFVSRVERVNDIGDIEQDATDLHVGLDYSFFEAMRAPKPTLLIFNAEDDCCFRAPLVKPYVYDAVIPFFALYGKPDALAWHENADPGNHNYQLDNRLQSYRFFARHFGLAPVDHEPPADADIKRTDELIVGLPGDNLTILGLARKLASDIDRGRAPGTGAGSLADSEERRDRLRDLVRLHDVDVAHAWPLDSTKSKGLETQFFRFEFTNGLSATGVLARALTAREDAPVSLILNDQGKKESYVEVSDGVNRGNQVLAVDLLFTGDAAPVDPATFQFAELIATTGDRPLGLESAQLAAIVRWAKSTLRRAP